MLLEGICWAGLTVVGGEWGSEADMLVSTEENGGGLVLNARLWCLKLLMKCRRTENWKLY